MAELIPVLGILGSGASAAAGGALAGLLQGTPNYGPAGGGTPGLTSTQTSGKNPMYPPITQIDPSTAIGYFNDAAQSFQSNTLQGLSYYNNSIQAAAADAAAGYGAANTTLEPMSAAGTQAMNQYMMMLGLAPQSPTYNYASTLAALGPQYSGLSQQVAAAENITDPQQRQLAMQSINSQINQTIGNNVANNNMAAADQIKALGPAPTQASANAYYDYVTANNNYNQQLVTQLASAQEGGGSVSLNPDMYTNAYNATDPWGNGQYTLAQQQALNSPGGAQELFGLQATNYDTAANTIQSTYNQQTAAANNALQNFETNYNLNYSPTASQGYTGQQVQNVLEATPGYQFTYNQGVAGLQASAAAAGVLNSGNTLLGIQQYGQGLASSTYNNYMSNLNNITNLGSQATNQIAGNYANLGTYLGNLAQSGGAAALQAYGNIGSAYQQEYNNSGNTQNQDNLANMKAQNDYQLALLNAQTSNANAAIGAGASMYNAGLSNNTAQGYLGLAAQGQAYNQFQNSGYGNGFENGTNSGYYPGQGYTIG